MQPAGLVPSRAHELKYKSFTLWDNCLKYFVTVMGSRLIMAPCLLIVTGWSLTAGTVLTIASQGIVPGASHRLCAQERHTD